MNLLVDIGNSRVKVALTKGLEVGSITSFSGGFRIEEIEQWLKSQFKEGGELEGEELEIVAISDVTKSDREQFKALESYCERLIVVDSKTALPIANNYSTPESLGSDRLMSAVGAAALYPGKDLLIFDFGTALTVDFVDGEKGYLGGNISPGLEMRFAALNQYTRALPHLKKVEKIEMIGGSTKEAIEAGVILGLIFEVESYIDNNPEHIFIFTGGEAKYFEEKMKSSIFVVYDLIMVGLAHIAKYYAKTER